VLLCGARAEQLENYFPPHGAKKQDVARTPLIVNMFSAQLSMCRRWCVAPRFTRRTWIAGQRGRTSSARGGQRM